MIGNWITLGGRQINLDHVASADVDYGTKDKYGLPMMVLRSIGDVTLGRGHADPDNFENRRARGIIPASPGFKIMTLFDLNTAAYTLNDISYEDVIGWQVHECGCAPITVDGLHEFHEGERKAILCPSGVVTRPCDTQWDSLTIWLDDMTKGESK